jgi:hypothetical protein
MSCTRATPCRGSHACATSRRLLLRRLAGFYSGVDTTPIHLSKTCRPLPLENSSRNRTLWALCFGGQVKSFELTRYKCYDISNYEMNFT